MRFFSKLGMGLIIGYSFFESFQLFKELTSTKFLRIDLITQHDKRYHEIRKALPQNTTVGYISSLSDPKNILSVDDITHEVQEYYLAQYALSPVVLERGKDYSFVVGNFYRPDIKIETDKNLTIIKDYGNGVLLLKNNLK
ncbi:hypothetical protein H6F90_01375 [Trichocoleus sp. FACHB-591]|uniref:hypothetical protein n=1 Tax=Trichocoleus sp. FACHB-591 TaxID=2692872 RepID=UPI0016847E98|nr:hypothetical protein [Trichocoleus sp. FACHB-591]MBD2093804.1 hypothetical protein [Trichocoleus sp. FACHB-591]